MVKPICEEKGLISSNEFKEDFNFVYETLKTYYPYFDVI